MGRDKAWLELDGRPLLVHVVEILASRCRPIVVAAAPGQRLPSVQGIVRVDDPEPGAGPLVGVVAGLAALAEAGVDRAYLGSSDAIGISVEHVAFMLDRLARPGLDAIVPRSSDGQLHPLAAALAVAPMLARARAQLEAGRPRLIELVTGPQIELVDADALPDPRVLAPCNTPQEWAALRGGARPTPE